MMQLSVNEGDSASKNEGETSLLCAKISSILEVKGSTIFLDSYSVLR